MAKLSIGGQAVIEGVMMRGPKDVAVAVRKADGTIDVDVKPVNSISDRYPILKKPLLRGVVALVESLVMGMKALSYSAQVSGDEDEQMDDKEMALTMVVSVALAVGLFIAIPTWSMRYLQQWTQSSLTLNLAEGFLRMGIFLVYIAAISSMEDIQRVFKYHGAEHKTIFTYEAGMPLTVENVRTFPRLPPLRHQLPDDRHADQHLYFCLSGLAQPGGTDPVPDRVNAGGGGHQLRADPLCRKE